MTGDEVNTGWLGLVPSRRAGRPSTRHTSPVTRHWRRARRAVVAGLAGFALLHLGLNLALDTVRPTWRDPEYGHRLRELKPLAARSPKLLVVLGSSRVQMGLNPAEVSLDGVTVYNLSQAGCGPAGELLNLRRLLREGVRPDFLLVECLPPVLAGDGPPESTLIADRLSLTDIRDIAPVCDDPNALRRGYRAARVNPWWHYRRVLLCHAGMGGWLPWQLRPDFMWRQLQPGGWLPYFFPEVDDAKRADGFDKAKREYAPYLTNYHIAAGPERCLRELAAVCRANGIRLGFVLMPEATAFRELYPPGARETATAFLRGLADGPVIDAGDWVADDRFADGHHLMRPGAAAFSRRLGPTLRPWTSAGGAAGP